MGRAEAIAVNALVEEWGVMENIRGMVFATTASNSGHINGLCAIFEMEFAKKKLLWFACRRHIDEVILSDVYKSLFGETSGPDIKLFKQFRDDCWEVLKVTHNSDYKTLIIKNRLLKARCDDVIEFYVGLLTTKNSKGELPRGDYRECALVMLQLLGKEPPRGCRWYKPGAIINCRWMVKCIYVAKILAFSDKLNLDDGVFDGLHRFAVFCALYYVPHWLTTPHAIDAPANDLQFLKHMTEFQSIDAGIATTATAALNRHLWYLTEELAPLSLFTLQKRK